MIFGVNTAFSTHSFYGIIKNKKKMWKVPFCLLVWAVNCENAFEKLHMHTARKKVPKNANGGVIRLIRRTFDVHNFALRKFFGSEILSK